MILNDITKDNNKVLGDEINETFKFHRLEKSMGEAVSIFQSIVEAEQRNGVPQKNYPWQKIRTPIVYQTRNRGWNNPIRGIK